MGKRLSTSFTLYIAQLVIKIPDASRIAYSYRETNSLQAPPIHPKISAYRLKINDRVISRSYIRSKVLFGFSPPSRYSVISESLLPVENWNSR